MSHWKQNGFKATGEQFLGVSRAPSLSDREVLFEPSDCVPERIECERSSCMTAWNPAERRSFLVRPAELAYRWSVTCPGCGATGTI